MGGQNVETVTRWSDALKRGELGEDFWDHELEIENAKGWLVDARYHGHEGLRRWWSDLAEAFSDFAMEIDEITPLDEERVLTTNRFVGHFRLTGIPFDGRWASVITVRDGRIIHAVGYFTKKQAVQASKASKA